LIIPQIIDLITIIKILSKGLTEQRIDLSISVVFNNGESRIIDFRKVLKKIRVNGSSPAYILN
jgi:hypothetical protein